MGRATEVSDRVGFRAWGLECRVKGLGSRVKGLECRVKGLGSRNHKGLEFSVKGLEGFRV